MTTSNEETSAAAATAASDNRKPPRRPAWRTARPLRRRRQGGQEGHPAKKAPKGAKKAKGPREGSKTDQDPGPAEAARRRHGEGADEGDWLAAAFGARVPVGDRRKEDGPYRGIRQGRGRRAQLLRQGLTASQAVPLAPPGFRLGGFSLSGSASVAPPTSPPAPGTGPRRPDCRRGVRLRSPRSRGRHVRFMPPPAGAPARSPRTCGRRHRAWLSCRSGSASAGR